MFNIVPSSRHIFNITSFTWYIYREKDINIDRYIYDIYRYIRVYYRFWFFNFKNIYSRKKGVQGRLESREMTSGAFWYAECPPSPAKPSLCLLLPRRASASLSPCPAFWSSTEDIWIFICKKRIFFLNNLNMIVFNNT